MIKGIREFIEVNYQIISILIGFLLLYYTARMIKRRGTGLVLEENPGFFKIGEFDIIEGDPVGLEINTVNNGSSSVREAEVSIILLTEYYEEEGERREKRIDIIYKESFRRTNPIEEGQRWRIRVPSVECRKKGMPELFFERYAIILLRYRRGVCSMLKKRKYFWDIGDQGRFVEPGDDVRNELTKLKPEGGRF